MKSAARSIAVALLLFTAATTFADIRVTVESNPPDAPAGFKFKQVPSPSNSDAATGAAFTAISGGIDPSGGGIDRLHDGKAPTEGDEPDANFFFAPGDDGGRFKIDLGKVIPVKQINVYSWHSDSRGPQVFTVFGSDGQRGGFNDAPGADIDPAKVGWIKIAAVDTRPKSDGGKPIEDGESMGGQYGSSISDTADATIGQYRYLLFVAKRTEDRDDFGNTFYSEIDVIDADAKTTSSTSPTTEKAAAPAILIEGKVATIDVTDAPDLQDWAKTKLLPAIDEWYPQIAAMLPSDGYTAQSHVMLRFRSDMKGTPAWTDRTGVSCNTQWFRKNIHGEGVGAVIHELVHVVQRYAYRPRRNATAEPNPGWLVEGLADYIRWYKYEPQSHGTDIHNPDRAKYDGSYRITANFLDYVSRTYDVTIVEKLNAAMRNAEYSETLWKKYTGKTVQELGAEWKQTFSPKDATHPSATSKGT